MVKRAVTPRLAAGEIRAHLAVGEPCGVIFGPERTGLVNADITLADTVLSVPMNPGFSSLNLAQAVLIVGYEWFIAREEPPAETLHTGHSRPATKEELVRFFDHFEEALVDSGFIRHPDKRPSLFRNLRKQPKLRAGAPDLPLQARLRQSRFQHRALDDIARNRFDLRRNRA